jgi:hypothetical protein
VDKNDFRFGGFKFYTDKIIQNRLKEITRTDSIYTEESTYLIYKSYDANSIMVKELRYFQGQSNSKRAYLIRNVFNTEGKTILYELFNMEGETLERCKFKYNPHGFLIEKEGTRSGEPEITIKYFYSVTGKLIDKKAFQSGKEIIDYFDCNKGRDTLIPAKTSF